MQSHSKKKQSKPSLTEEMTKLTLTCRKNSGDKNAATQKLQIEMPSTSAKSSTNSDMAQCPICGRSFLIHRFKIHEGICKKASTKKRALFDPVKHRLAGTDAETYLNVGTFQLKSVKAATPKPKVDWRRKHEEFIVVIHAAKEVQHHLPKGGSSKDFPPSPLLDSLNFVQCPHCKRKFYSTVAEKHIPICSQINPNKSEPSKQLI